MSLPPIRVLVVGTTLDRRLGGPGIRWVLRPDAEEALAWARRVRPDVVLLGGPADARAWARRLREASPETRVLLAA